MLKHDQLIASLVKRAAKSSQHTLARDLGISATYLGEILKGKKAPGKKLLDAMNLERVVYYKQKSAQTS